MALKYKTSRFKNFSGALQVPGGIPLDIRNVVPTLADLMLAETWYKINDDGTLDNKVCTAYNGMIVVVENEGCPYVCINSAAVTARASWKKIGVDLDVEGSVVNIVKWTDPSTGIPAYYESTDTEHEHPITHPSVIEGGEGQYIKLILGDDVAYIKSSKIIDLTQYYTKTEIDASVNAALATRDASIANLDSSVNILEGRADVLDASVNIIEETLRNGVVSSFKAQGENFVRVSPTTGTHGDVTLDVSTTLADCSNNITTFVESGLTTDKYVEERFAWVEITD